MARTYKDSINLLHKLDGAWLFHLRNIFERNSSPIELNIQLNSDVVQQNRLLLKLYAISFSDGPARRTKEHFSSCPKFSNFHPLPSIIASTTHYNTRTNTNSRKNILIWVFLSSRLTNSYLFLCRPPFLLYQYFHSNSFFEHLFLYMSSLTKSPLVPHCPFINCFYSLSNPKEEKKEPPQLFWFYLLFFTQL